MSKQPLLKPGTYVLPDNVMNPCKDRRYKHDWRRKPSLHAGKYIVEVYTEELMRSENGKPVLYHDTRIRPLNAPYFHQNATRTAFREIYDILVQVFIGQAPTTETPRDRAQRLLEGVDCRALLLDLVEHGDVDVDVIQTLLELDDPVYQ